MYEYWVPASTEKSVLEYQSTEVPSTLAPSLDYQQQRYLH